MNQARLVGYTCVFALVFLTVWAAYAIHRESLHPSRAIRVRFPELGTLLVEAPVVEDGALIGRVRRLSLQDGGAMAEIELFRRDFVAADSRFINFNHSLMGERLVVLAPGQSGIPMDESKIQTGIFADGVAETMSRVDELLALVIELRAQSGRLFAGPGAVLSPEFMNGMEKSAISLNQMARQIDEGGKSMHTGLEAWIHARNAIQGGLISADSNLDTSENRTKNLLAAASIAERNADSVLTSAERLLSSLKDSSGAAHSLLYDRAAYDDLKGTLGILETSLHAFHEKSLNGAVRWRNLHFFRSASP